MRAVQYPEQRIELQLDALVVLPEQRSEQQSTGNPA